MTKTQKLRNGILAADLFWVVVAMALAYLLRYESTWKDPTRIPISAFLPFLTAALILWSVLSPWLHMDGFRGGWRLSAVVSQLLLSVGGLMLILLSGGYLFREYVSRLTLVHFGLLLLAGFVLIRIAAYHLMRSRSKNGSARRAVIVGRGRLARELARKIRGHPEMLCNVVGFLEPDDGTWDSGAVRAATGTAANTPVRGVVDLLCERQVDELILALEEYAPRDLFNLTALCRSREIAVSVVPQFYNLYLSRSHLIDLDGLPVLQLAKPELSRAAMVWKRGLDFVLGAVLSLAAIPVIGVLAAALYCIKGKAFRWETRCGFRGKLFAMLRLNIDRTDSNASRFEAVLRKFSLTELPQLWNVLRGDMSLVGPRPESPHRVYRYSEWQQQRLNVKPGMTGLAQVQGLREQHSSEEKTRFDLQYLLSSSLWTDLSLLLQTVWTLATRSANRGDSIADMGLAGAANDAVRPPMQQEILESAHRS